MSTDDKIIIPTPTPNRTVGARATRLPQPSSRGGRGSGPVTPRQPSLVQSPAATPDGDAPSRPSSRRISPPGKGQPLPNANRNGSAMSPPTTRAHKRHGHSSAKYSPRANSPDRSRRRPRTIGLPPKMAGFTVIRSSSVRSGTRGPYQTALPQAAPVGCAPRVMSSTSARPQTPSAANILAVRRLSPTRPGRSDQRGWPRPRRRRWQGPARHRRSETARVRDRQRQGGATSRSIHRRGAFSRRHRLTPRAGSLPT